MAIVGLIGLAKLTGLAGALGGLFTSSLKGSTIEASAAGATLKLSGLALVAIAAAEYQFVGSKTAKAFESSAGELGFTELEGEYHKFWDNPLIYSIKSLFDIGDVFEEEGLKGGLLELGNAFTEMFAPDSEFNQTLQNLLGVERTLNKVDSTSFAEAMSGKIAGHKHDLQVITQEQLKQIDEANKAFESFRNLFKGGGNNELNTSDLGTSMLGAWKNFAGGADEAGVKVKSLSETVSAFIDKTKDLNSETSRFGYEAENSTSKFRFGISGIASETVNTFQNAYDRGTKTWSGLGSWAKTKSKDMGNGFVTIPKEVSSKFQTAYTESTKAWNDIGAWANGVADTTVNGMDNLPSDVSKRFGDAYTQGTAKWNDLGRWATERSAITSGAFNTFPTSASKQFGDAYTQGTGKWGGLKTWADTTFSAVSTASNTNLSKIPSQFQTNFQQGTAKAEGLVGSFKTWLDRQNLVKKAGVEPDTFAFSNVQSKINNIISSLARVKSTTISISGNGFEAVGTKIKNLANQLTNLKNTSSSVSLGSSLGLKLFASGGVVGGATPAIVGEAGPEAILPLTDGTLGKLANMIVGDMAVPNSPVLANQSYSSYSNTMNASSMADQNKLLQEQNELLRQIASKDLTISSSEVFNATRSEANNYYNRTGNSPFLI